MHHITVLPSGHRFQADAGQTILEAALAAGLTLPYSCKNGACSSCKGRLVSGQVQLGAHQPQALDSRDVEQGMTLFCVARPMSDVQIEAREVLGLGDIVARKLPCRVLAMTPAAPDVRIVALQLPAAETSFAFKAGQYIDILLKDGRRRSYSIANAPHERGALQLHIRHLPGGAFTDRVFGVAEPRLSVRDILRFEGPQGSFFLREDSERPIVMVASGTGFAPIRAMVEHMIAAGIRRPVSVYWGGRRPRDLYLHDVALGWAQRLPGLRYVPVVSGALPEDGWTGRTGFVHAAVLDDYPSLSAHEVYACGAPLVVAAARADFTALRGLPADAFYADSFTSEADMAQDTV